MPQSFKEGCQAAYYTHHGETLLAAYLKREQAEGERIIVENDDWMVVLEKNVDQNVNSLINQFVVV